MLFLVGLLQDDVLLCQHLVKQNSATKYFPPALHYNLHLGDLPGPYRQLSLQPLSMPYKGSENPQSSDFLTETLSE